MTDEEPAHDDGRLLCDVIDHHARTHADRPALAERRGADWRILTYRDVSRRIRFLAQGLLDRGHLKGDRMAIVAANGIDHACLMLAALSIGGVVATLSPMPLARPGGLTEVQALLARLDPVWVVTDTAETARSLDSRRATRLLAIRQGAVLDLLSAPRRALERARQAVMPSDVAKILFTSGSSGSPKAVLHTHAMLTAAQVATHQVYVQTEHSRTVDWLPWHHTFGGNVNLNGTLWRGDTLWIDQGLPVPNAFEETLRNLAEIEPTFFASVPSAFPLLAERLESDAAFAAAFFRNLKGWSAGGAALSPGLVEHLQTLAVRACGYRIPFGAGYGMTETCGITTLTYWLSTDPACIGLPPPGVALRLLPMDADRFEVRVRGPQVTPGYLDDPQATARLFDEDGWLRTGDSVSWIDPTDPERGLKFAGRLVEDFKLANGTFVRAGQLRAELVEALGPMVGDVLIVGEGRTDVRALLWPAPDHRHVLAGPVTQDIMDRLATFNAARAGASRRIERVAWFSSPLDARQGEVADKGSLNVVALRARRSTEIADLYADCPTPSREPA